MRVGYAPGAFDLFHVGHLNLLAQARSRCDRLVAGVVSDEMLTLVKGVTPTIRLEERLQIVRHIDYVDEAVAETVADKLEVWEQLRFDVLFKGDDWKGTPRGDRLVERFAAVGVDVEFFPYTVTTSSTVLRRALSSRLAEATG